MKNTRLIILETKSDFENYLKDSYISKDIIFAIGPKAKYELEIRKINYYTFSDSWNNKEYKEAITKNNEKIDNLINDLDFYCKNNLRNDLEIGKYFSFQLWLIISQINFNIFFLTKVIKKFNPNKILIFCKNEYVTLMGFRPDPSSYIYEILKNSPLKEELNIEFIFSKKLRSKRSIKEKILINLPFNFVNNLRFLKNSTELFSLKRAKRNMLLIGGCKEWLELCKSKFFKKKYNFKFQFVLQKKSSEKIDQILINILNKALFNESTLSYKMDKIASHINSAIETFNANIQKVDKYIKKFDLVVSSTLIYPEDNFFAHRTSKCQKPLLVWQHGEKGAFGFDILAQYQELYFATDYLSYSEFIKEMYSPWKGKNFLREVISVGSIDKKPTISDRKKDSIIYATGKWFLSGQVFDNPSDPDKRLYDLQKNILNFLNNLDTKYKKVFKLNNSLFFNEYPFNFKNIVTSKEPFTKVLDEAVLVILDTPATTLLEAASTNVPIFAISGRNKYTPEFINSVSKRCVWCNSKEELFTKIDLFIKHNKYDSDLKDRDLINKYASFNDFNKVVENVSKACDNAITRNGKL